MTAMYPGLHELEILNDRIERFPSRKRTEARNTFSISLLAIGWK